MNVNRASRRKLGRGLPPAVEAMMPKRRATFQVPVCSICNKEVEKFELVRDGDFSTLVAYCHEDVSTSKPFREEELDKMYTFKAFLDRKRVTFEGTSILKPTDYNQLQGSATDKAKLIQAFKRK